ncbi:MAG: GNAT family N-acetyltransferase [Cyanobacteriota bacterium]|nr:GNAT family N-acetyltransferase [Cyanobacteriota bacterium]
MKNLSISSPFRCKVRPATARDIWTLRKMVLGAKLDPTQLRWQQFWTIECEGTVVACAQLRQFSQAQELGSLVVIPPWRGRGLGTYLVQYLVERATQPLYLECLGTQLERFYTRLGFVPISWSELPRSLKLKFGISQLARIVFKIPVAIMEYRGGTENGERGMDGKHALDREIALKFPLK